METPGYSWLTVHRAKFAQPHGATEDELAGPVSAAAWRCGPDAPIGSAGIRTEVSDIWGGLAFHDSEKSAREMLALAPGDLPFARHATEGWHGLLAVIAHRGEIHLSAHGQARLGFVPLAQDPGGVMAVVTSAGYKAYDETQTDRIVDFLGKVEEVRAFYAGLKGNVVRQLFNFHNSPDGVTFTVWRSDQAMMQAAYKDGAHRQFIDQHKAQPMFDRSSFTRFRLLDSRGSWGGLDPLADAA